MADSTPIDALVDRLSRLPGAQVGRGPRHPRSPDAAVAPRLDTFLSEHPTLRDDAGYIEFQEKYAGAMIQHPGRRQIVDILGFSDASTDMQEMEGPVVDDDGFLVFAECIHHITVDGRLEEVHEQAFAFSVVSGRRPGIYRLVSTMADQSGEYRWYTDDFTVWLRDLVDNDGWSTPMDPT
ncbi:MAG TPA: hypothetical protein VOB72_23655 [Candidatus Dormibacteraeota bacterium]|nr:hypothetical protein [Candidatus Dormibacteraeota bacterium]